MTQEPTASRNDGRPPIGFGRVRMRGADRPRAGNGGNDEESAALIGESRAMHRLRAEVSGLARRDDTVILTGETGVGKDLVALQLHRERPRRTRTFVTLCCPWLDEERVTALSRDAGGVQGGSGPRDATGLSGRAGPIGDGTLFLDRVDEADLLVLQRIARLVDGPPGPGGAGDRSWRTRGRAPAGSTPARGAPRPRLIASVGNGSIEGKYLAQLLAALFEARRITQLEIPPLRSRRDDVPLLLEHFRRHFDRREGRRSRFSQRFLDHALEHSWPGNVRELRNVVENAHILADGGLLDAWSVSGS